MTLGVVIVDAVGTLIVPEPEAAITYCRVAEIHRVRREPARVAELLRKQLRIQQQLAATRPTSPDIERRLWSTIVQNALELDGDAHAMIFPDLWDVFAIPEYWRTVPHAVETIDELQNRGWSVVVASNFDARLKSLWSAWEALPTDIRLFTCDEVGWRKPHAKFYQHVQKALQQDEQGDKIGNGRIVMIGDELDCDVIAPCAAGWHAIWLTDDAVGARLPSNARAASTWKEALELLNSTQLS